MIQFESIYPIERSKFMIFWRTRSGEEADWKCTVRERSDSDAVRRYISNNMEYYMGSIATIVQYYGTSNFLDHPRNNYLMYHLHLWS